jgi:hypothetical protein
VGLVVVALSPIGYIVLFALVASIIGEDHLEGPNSSVALRTSLFVVPIFVGAALIALDWFGVTIGARRLPLAGLVVGPLLIVVGVTSVRNDEIGDANIGAGVLILVGIALTGLAAGFKIWADRNWPSSQDTTDTDTMEK